jgi:hypothetical protein
MEKCLRHLQGSPEQWPGVKKIVHTAIRRTRHDKSSWFQALNLLTRYRDEVPGHHDEKRLLSYEFVRELAYSDFNLSKGEETGGSGQRKTFENFLEHMLKEKRWVDYLSIQEFGAALERSSGFRIALEFYERYLNSHDEDEKQFARARWLNVKRRQEHYYREREREDDHIEAGRIRGEVSRRAREWRIPEPVADASVADDTAKYPQLEQRRVIAPPEINIEERTNGDIVFQVQSIRVHANKARKRINVHDEETMDTIQIVLDEKAIKTDSSEVQHKKSDGSDLEAFEVHSRGYSGTLESKEGRTILKLYFTALSSDITIDIGSS